MPPPGVRPGSPAYRLFREEAYQSMRRQIGDRGRQLRQLNKPKFQQIEAMRKEALSATPPQRLADSA